MSEINQWYSGRNVLVTGATGFIGKCLVEKLLRDTEGIGDVYILIRRKNGSTFEQRRDQYKRHIAFKNLMDRRPEMMNKIKMIEGNLLSPGLDISDDDRRAIVENVSVIFHSAADVRFDRPLNDAFQINVKGTKRMLELACEIQHLDAFVFVSTAFSQTHDVVLDEKLYPAPISPLEMEKLIDFFDEDTLNALTPKLLGKFPNTYGLTKCLSEELVDKYREKFPVAIARPPIVITSWREPHAGYTEGFHGINGWGLAVGRGVLRTMLCQGEYPCNVVQADIAVNALIVLGRERGQDKSSETVFFNICEEIGKPMSWNKYLENLKIAFFSTPYNYAMWLPGGSFKSNFIYHFICDILFQYFPALLIDLILLIMWKKPVMIKIQHKIHAGCNVLEYYLNHKFLFKTEKYMGSYEKLNKVDKTLYYDRTELNFAEYCRIATLGTKVYLVKEKVEDLPKARRFMRRMYYIDLIFKAFIVAFFINYFLPYIYKFLS